MEYIPAENVWVPIEADNYIINEIPNEKKNLAIIEQIRGDEQ